MYVPNSAVIALSLFLQQEQQKEKSIQQGDSS